MICAFVCLHSIGVLEFELGGPHNKSSAHAGRPARALLACIMLINVLNDRQNWLKGPQGPLPHLLPSGGACSDEGGRLRLQWVCHVNQCVERQTEMAD
jgi:hypothetical protein